LIANPRSKHAAVSPTNDARPATDRNETLCHPNESVLKPYPGETLRGLPAAGPGLVEAPVPSLVAAPRTWRKEILSTPAPTRNDRLPATAAGLTILFAIAGFASLPRTLAADPPLPLATNVPVVETLAAPAAPPATGLDLQPASDNLAPAAAGPCLADCAPVRAPDTGDGGMR
jgi:hypothetical protein